MVSSPYFACVQPNTQDLHHLGQYPFYAAYRTKGPKFSTRGQRSAKGGPKPVLAGAAPMRHRPGSLKIGPGYKTRPKYLVELTCSPMAERPVPMAVPMAEP
jgi:hypothetical protein